MQKVLDFLERYVQWVVVGLAALFLLFALYSYLPGVAQPVKTELVSGEPLSPGDVDPRIAERADELQTRVDANPTFAPLKVPDYARQLRDAIAAPIKTTPLPPAVLFVRGVEYPPGFDPDAQSSTPNNNVAGRVNALPVLPPPLLEPTPSTNFAQVTVAPAGAAPAAQPAAAANPAVPAPAGQNAGQNVDTTWVRVPFKISAGNLTQAFRNANIPPNWSSTSFLRVELIRQKQLPGGQWSPEEVVPPLPTLGLLPMPREGPENFQPQQAYLAWATQNQKPIVQPDFFPVVAGANPAFEEPADVALPVAGGPAAGGGAFDVTPYLPPGTDLSGLTQAELAAVLEERRRRAKEAQDTPRPPRGGGGPGGGGKGGGGGMSAVPPDSTDPTFTPGGVALVIDAEPAAPSTSDGASPVASTVATFSRVRPANPGGPPPGGYPGMPGGGFGDGYPGVVPGMPADPTAPAAAVAIVFAPLPQAPFQPEAVQGQIDGWAYDVTAVADATYRYRIRYVLKNPIFGAQNVAANPQLSQAFALAGEDPQAWTDPITIAPLTHVYLASRPTAGGNTVRFTVFRWQEGQRRRTTATASPGDSIGKADGEVDFRTPWTLVEVRRDTSSNEAYALLMNADGMLKRLAFDADNASSEFKRLNSEVDAGTTPSPAEATPGGPAGGPPAVGPGGGRPGGEGPTT